MDFDFNPIVTQKFNDVKELETELVKIVKALTLEQQKGLYVLLMPYLKI